MGDTGRTRCKEVQGPGADVFHRTERGDPVPVDVAQVDPRLDGEAEEAFPGNYGLIEHVDSPVPLHVEVEPVGVVRRDGYSQELGVLQPVPSVRRDAVFESATVAELGVGTGKGVDVRRIPEGRAVERIVHEEPGDAAVPRLLIVLAEVGRYPSRGG